jgi:glycosyltransferase involved in cell wall biosynthesis
LLESKAVGDLIDLGRIRTSPLQIVPLRKHVFRYLAPLYPWAFEHFDLSAYDVVVSSTTSWAKGVRFRPDATHVCYINTVSRFLFNYDHYVDGLVAMQATDAFKRVLRTVARPLIDDLIRWDRMAADRPTAFIANSRNVARRVRHFYGRDAFVLPCPVDVSQFTVGQGRGGYALVISRLLPYKRVDLAIDACIEADIPLVVIGTGPCESRLRERAARGNVRMLGAVDDETRRNALADAAFVILPGEEDFGLVPLEAAAAGRPTVALRAGGALETIIEGVSGMYFDEPNATSLAAALQTIRVNDFNPQRLREHALEFAPNRFSERLLDLVERIRIGERPLPVVD